ncbi:MAG TPA: hypothetical protein VK639_14070 [Terriglobales bacterium]|nr:hypothetical protein [Terriglobales bacterium]
MSTFDNMPGLFSYAGELRRELSLRNQQYARRLQLLNRESYGEPPSICYLPSEDGMSHGNFLRESYCAIVRNPNWRKRLQKAHSQARSALPREDRRWKELDSSNSSDALLMNIFCFPGTLRSRRVLDLLGVEAGFVPEFGFRARVPLANGRADRTEVDMRLGELLVESKLTESDFQCREVALVKSYRDFADVFECRKLPQDARGFLSYQLIRNVLAAHHSQCSFCVMLDARRPDLREAWFAVMSCIRIIDLRLRCKVLTWQELAEVLPAKLQRFLQEKYGIAAGNASATLGNELFAANV